jgi:negative regulator of flagellin synthesis FlgM
MSYASGINILQQAANSFAPSDTKSVAKSQVVESALDKNEVSATGGAHGDQTDISSTGGIVTQSLESSDTRPERVSLLQEAIATGSYSVSPSDIATKIIQSLLEH